MNRPRKLWLVLLVAFAALWAGLVVSRHAALYWVSNTTNTEAPTDGPEAAYGAIPTFRCHYFTGWGTFTTETSMAFGADPSHLIVPGRD